MDKVASNLHTKVDDVAQDNFRSWISEGIKLSMKHLRKLNSVWKKDYTTQMIKESE